MTERPVGAKDQLPAAEAVRRNVKPAGLEKHWFVGLDDGNCVVPGCGLPDTNPIHYYHEVKL